MKTMKKALLLHSDFGIGGAERLMLDVGLTLKNLGYRVDYYTNYFNRDRCFDEFNTEDLPVVSYFSWTPVSVCGRFHVMISLLKMLLMSVWIVLSELVVSRSPKYSLVVTDGAGYISVPLFKLFGYKVLFYCHFPDQLLVTNTSLLSRLYRAPIDMIEEKCTACSDVVAVNSNFTKNIVLKQFASVRAFYKSNPNYIQVVYPCVNFSKFQLRSSQEENKTQIAHTLNTHGQFSTLFLCLNRFERKKKLSIAVQAFHRLKQISTENNKPHLFDNSLLVVMGGYDERVDENVSYELELKSLAASLELDSNVKFLRSPDDQLKFKLLSIAAAVIYTPSNEHFGIVPIESMASGCPVIAVNSGGPLETVIHGRTGYLCENSPDQFAQMMYTIVSDPKLADSLGKNGVNHVCKNFSITHFERVISKLISTIH